MDRLTLRKLCMAPCSVNTVCRISKQIHYTVDYRLRDTRPTVCVHQVGSPTIAGSCHQQSAKLNLQKNYQLQFTWDFRGQVTLFVSGKLPEII